MPSSNPPTNTKVPTPSNPSSLPSRYSIRQLQPHHIEWATAILMHSNGFHSPVWPVVYPHDITARIFKGTPKMEYLIRHQVLSGMSFGVFDDEYEFKRPESKQLGIDAGIPEGGHLWWSPKDSSIEAEQGLEAEAKRMEDQMDFPLVSIAMSYDAFNPLDMEKLGSIIEELPLYATIYGVLAAGDTRDPESWGPTGPGQVLMRNATSTKNSYGGQGIMSGLARWLMREAAQKGWRSIQIECIHDAVTKTWSEPPKPFKGHIVAEFHTGTFVDEEGNHPFAPAKQRITKCFVDLVGDKE
jgi:hypothetical protein